MLCKTGTGLDMMHDRSNPSSISLTPIIPLQTFRLCSRVPRILSYNKRRKSKVDARQGHITAYDTAEQSYIFDGILVDRMAHFVRTSLASVHVPFFPSPLYSTFPKTLSKSSCANNSVPGLFVHQATLFPLLLSPHHPASPTTS